MLLGSRAASGCRRRRCRRPATTCSKLPSRASSKTSAPRWPRTGQTWNPSPGPRRPGRPLRRPRGLLGTPQEQPVAQRERAVLRLLLLRRHHDARGEQAARPRVRPSHDALVVPVRPGTRPRARPGRDARRRRPARRHPADSGYAHRDADAWAIPLRQAGAQLVQDLHLHDRGAKGTCQGAIIARPGQAITFDVASPDRGGSRTVVCSLSTSANLSAGALVGGHGMFSMRVARWNAVAISLA